MEDQIIDVKYNFIWEIKVIQVQKINTADNPTNMLMNPMLEIIQHI